MIDEVVRPPVVPRPDYFEDPEPVAEAEEADSAEPARLDEGRELAAIIAGGCLSGFWVLLLAETPRLLNNVQSGQFPGFMRDMLSLLVYATMFLATCAVAGLSLAIYRWARRH